MSASQSARQCGVTNADGRQNEVKRSFPKTHANYWKARLEHCSYNRDGKTFEIAERAVRIHFKGIRRSFDLESANKEEAATKARDIYLSIITKGWFSTLAQLTPQAMSPIEAKDGSRTVGEFLVEVERASNLKPKTFRRYAQYFRCWPHRFEG